MAQKQTTDTPTTDTNSRQQIVDSIKNNNNVLVTVSTNPSVDELSAALGLTILLNKLGKRGTAVVSGDIPPAINFLDPDKTFENTADSLRDFIIALDKDKADHLRYKLDGDMVKIFITPYRTQLSEDDLEISLGDYNVEVVIALGVQDQDHLDKALDSHGAILHDATVITLTAGSTGSNLGGINWQDASASSLCEMLVSLSEALKEDKPLLDKQVSTAFLTGIVSATDRFSNDHTTSRVMTMAAQLMAAGANQQLIAAKLEEAHEIGPNAKPAASTPESEVHSDGSKSLVEGAEALSLNLDPAAQATNTGNMMIEINHPEPETAVPAKEADPEPELPPVLVPPPVPEPALVQPLEASPVASSPSDAPAAPTETAEEALARELAEVLPATPAPNEPLPSMQEELAAASTESPEPADPTKLDFEAIMPTIPAAAPAPAPIPAAPSPDISKHEADNGYVSGEPNGISAINGTSAPDPSSVTIDPFAAPMNSQNLPPLQPDPLFDTQMSSGPQVAPAVAPLHAPSEIQYEEPQTSPDLAAMAAVPDFAASNPTGIAPLTPDGNIAASTTPPVPAEPSPSPSLDALPPLPPLPPMPDFSATPPPPDTISPSPPVLPETPQGDDTPPPPGQFKIPGQ